MSQQPFSIKSKLHELSDKIFELQEKLTDAEYKDLLEGIGCLFKHVDSRPENRLVVDNRPQNNTSSSSSSSTSSSRESNVQSSTTTHTSGPLARTFHSNLSASFTCICNSQQFKCITNERMPNCMNKCFIFAQSKLVHMVFYLYPKTRRFYRDLRMPLIRLYDIPNFDDIPEHIKPQKFKMFDFHFRLILCSKNVKFEWLLTYVATIDFCLRYWNIYQQTDKHTMYSKLLFTVLDYIIQEPRHVRFLQNLVGKFFTTPLQNTIFSWHQLFEQMKPTFDTDPSTDAWIKTIFDVERIRITDYSTFNSFNINDLMLLPDPIINHSYDNINEDELQRLIPAQSTSTTSTTTSTSVSVSSSTQPQSGRSQTQFILSRQPKNPNAEDEGKCPFLYMITSKEFRKGDRCGRDVYRDGFCDKHQRNKRK